MNRQNLATKILGFMTFRLISIPGWWHWFRVMSPSVWADFAVEAWWAPSMSSQLPTAYSIPTPPPSSQKISRFLGGCQRHKLYYWVFSGQVGRSRPQHGGGDNSSRENYRSYQDHHSSWLQWVLESIISTRGQLSCSGQTPDNSLPFLIKDIAVLELAEEVDLTLYTPICLPRSGVTEQGE